MVDEQDAEFASLEAGLSTSGSADLDLAEAVLAAAGVVVTVEP